MEQDAEFVEIYARGFRATPELVAVTTPPEGRVVDINEGFLRALGYTREEVIGRTVGELGLWADAEARGRMLEQLERSDSAIVEARFQTKAGDVRDFRVAADLVPAGDHAYIFTIARDITEDLASEADLAQTLESLRTLTDERRRLIARVLRAQSEERARISAEIHGDTVQQLTAAQLRLHLIKEQVADEQRTELEGLEQAMAAAIERLRSFMWELRPPSLDQEGLAATLQLTLRRMGEEEGWAFHLDDRLSREPSDQSATIAYRIVRESLTNVSKHARAKKVDVTLQEREGDLWVTVADDGTGFELAEAMDHPQPGHFGLQSMHDLIRLAQGSLQVTSSPGRGTTVEFRVSMTMDLESSGGG